MTRTYLLLWYLCVTRHHPDLLVCIFRPFSIKWEAGSTRINKRQIPRQIVIINGNIVIHGFPLAFRKRWREVHIHHRNIFIAIHGWRVNIGCGEEKDSTRSSSLDLFVLNTWGVGKTLISGHTHRWQSLTFLQTHRLLLLSKTPPYRWIDRSVRKNMQIFVKTYVAQVLISSMNSSSSFTA